MLTTGESVEKEEKVIAAVLEKFGLNWASIESTSGRSAAELLPKTISYITIVTKLQNECTTLERTAICSALLTWQSTASKSIKHTALYSNQPDTPCFTRIISAILSILALPNDSPISYKYGMQMPGLYLSQLLLRESKESVTAANELSKPIAKSLELAFAKNSKSNKESLILKEDSVTTSPGPALVSADSVRAETVKNLVKCISDHCKFTHSCALFLKFKCHIPSK